MVDLARRQEYESAGLDVADIAADPIEQIQSWLEAWTELSPDEPTAVVLATAGLDGGASARNVLLRGLDERGLTFFTSYESRKAREIERDERATLLFSWVPVRRQIHVTGTVRATERAESEAYFATRPRGSQLAAWASTQSAVLPDRAALEARLAAVAARFDGTAVPCPPHWGGYRLVPDSVELWQGRADRLHDRLRYSRDPAAPSGWRIERLSP